MSVEGINISLAQVSATAQSIRSINESLSARLEEIKREMNQLSSSWQSDASNTITNNYDAVETSLVNNANAFK
jgi:uncharacterized protein YukE